MTVAARENDGPEVRRASSAALGSLLALYAVARFLPLAGDKVPITMIAAMHILPPLLFALIHGAALFGRRGILMFCILFLIIGNITENLSVITGFPFGHYHFTDCLGTKLFHVPILLGLAYLGIGYISWALAHVILGNHNGRYPVAGFRLIGQPLAASFVMVAWDFSQDPVWSTVQHCWIWLHGGSYFGVPVSNFLGWYLTVYICYQVFALYLRRRPAVPNPLPPRQWQLAVLFYAVCAAGNIVLLLGAPPGGHDIVADPAGAPWRVHDIVSASALVSLFTMGPFALFAWFRLADHSKEESSL